MGRPKRPVAGKRIRKAEWVAEAVRLAIKGWSTRRIGEKIGKHWTTVHEALCREFERRRPSDEELDAAREVMREKLLRREAKLNELILSHWPNAKFDTDHAKIVLDADKGLDRVHASLCRLDGLDAPRRTELTGRDGSPLVEAGAIDDVLSLLARRAPDSGTGGADPQPDS